MGLFDFFNNIPTLSEMKGGFGERMAKYYAQIFSDTLILHDVLIDSAGGNTSQIDLLMIGSKGIYVIEVKMYPYANVYGDTDRPTWYYYNHGKKYEIYNPLMQNKKHVKYLKTFLSGFGNVPCFSVIAMVCNNFKISGKINDDNEKDTAVCNSFPAMRTAIEEIANDKPIVFDDARKQEIFNYIQNNQHKGLDARIEHKNKVISYKENLDEMKKQKICPYCKTQLILRKGKYGEFYGCSNYPNCKYTLK